MLSILAQTLSASTAPQGSVLTLLLPFALLIGAMYFMLIRPQQKRMRKQKEMWRELEVDEEVLTIGGIFGTIKRIDEEEDEIILEVAPGTTVRLVKNAIARRISAEDHEDGLPEAWTEEDDEDLEARAGSGSDDDDDGDPEAGSDS